MPLRHRSGYAVVLHRSLPADRDNRPKSSPPGQARRVRTATQPISARFELVEALKGVTPLVPHVHLFPLVNRTRAVRQYRHVPALSRLLPPFPASPGSGCLQLLTARYDGPSTESFHLRTVEQRLVAHAAPLPVLGPQAALRSGSACHQKDRSPHAVVTI